MFRKIAVRAGALALVPAAFAGVSIGAQSAHAATPVVTKAGSYQFDSDAPSTAGFNLYSNKPVTHSDASEKLSTDGVDLSSTGTSADAGIVYPLGRLSSLFNADGQYVPPVIAGAGLETNYNLYIDTNGDGSYFGWAADGSNSPYIDTGNDLQGDNKFSVANGASTTALLGGYTGESTLFANGQTYSLQAVKAAYAARTDGGTQDPLVWAWIGAGDAAGTSTGHIASVNGHDLVTVTAPPPTQPAPVVLSAGHVVTGTLLPSRAEVAWTAKPAAAEYKVVINGPGFANRANTIKASAAFYTGLHGGHTYVVTVTPENSDGSTAGGSGHVTFVTPTS